ncbi:hypothetical protein F5B20DRAFT_577289 [Whalleya microplaca]|nr:hypothetical protein F5B20DRAFT_577289 [Whalleya microplaca]
MSYQYLPPQSSSEIEAGYIANYPTSTTQSMEVRAAQQAQPPLPPLPPPPVHQAQDIQIPTVQRRQSLSRAFKLKRSLSTPNVRPQGMSDATQQPVSLPGEKKRNKLGYPRTPMACGNCRRRKIRCEAQKDDTQGRCVTCIRLKKECIYYPVDQPPPPQRLEGRSSSGTRLTSAATSPVMTTGHLAEVRPHLPYHQLTARPSLQAIVPSSSIKIPGNEPYPPDSKVTSSASSSRSFDYGPGMTGWISTEAAPSAAKTPSDLNTPWRNYSHESPATPGYPPYTPHAAASSSTWQTAPLGPPSRINTATRPDDPWTSYPPPTRSLSYSGEQSGQYPSSTRSYSGTQPQLAADEIDPHGSLSAGAVPPPNYGTWQPPYQYPKPSEAYSGGWYGSGGNPPDAHVPPGAENPSQAGTMYYSGRHH